MAAPSPLRKINGLGISVRILPVKMIVADDRTTDERSCGPDSGAAASTLVQSSFNWLVDNYGRVAD